jgi:hypothetical protein
MTLFHGYFARRKSDFVIESDSPPPAFDAPYGVYRCMKEMRALLAWLRAKGVVSKTPLHTMRKEFGNQIHARYGLLAASEQLRHGGIAVTARHYVENRSHSVLGFGHLLTKDGRTIVPMDESQASSDKELAEYEAAFNARPEGPALARREIAQIKELTK